MTTETETKPAFNLDCSLDDLWAMRETINAEIKANYEMRASVDAELQRRILAAHPDFTEATGGGVTIAGEEILLTMTYDRDYGFNEEALQRLAASEILTPSEYSKLVKWEPKVNGTEYNTLQRRGAEFIEALEGVRYLKHAAPKYEMKARK